MHWLDHTYYLTTQFCLLVGIKWLQTQHVNIMQPVGEFKAPPPPPPPACDTANTCGHTDLCTQFVMIDL